MTIHHQSSAHIHMDPILADSQSNGGQKAPDCIPGATGLRMKTRIKAGILGCKNALDCADSNHAATGLRVKTSIKAGIQCCKNGAECADTNDTTTGLRVPVSA